MSSNNPLLERSASAVARALLRRSSGFQGKRISTSHANHVTSVDIQSTPIIDTPNNEQLKTSDFELLTVTDEESDSTAEERVTQSSTADNFPDSIDPIDFIENNPRLTHPHTTHYFHNSTMGGGRNTGHHYENWSMFVNSKDLEELARKSESTEIVLISFPCIC